MVQFTADPTRLVTLSFGGLTFKGSQRTHAHLLHTQERLSRQHPGATIHVIQGCYNTGVALSAGTHDYDATVDVSVSGLGWWDAQKFLRQCGWAAWYRHTGSWASPSNWHIHMTSLGAAAAGCTVGEYIDGGQSLYGHVVATSQVDDYMRHALGLVGLHNSGSDTSWFPKNIKSTIFNYAAWLHNQEDNMPYSDWPDADKKALVGDVVSGILNATVGPDTDKTPVRTALYRASNVPDLIRAKTKSGVRNVVAKLTGKA